MNGNYSIVELLVVFIALLSGKEPRTSAEQAVMQVIHLNRPIGCFFEVVRNLSVHLFANASYEGADWCGFTVFTNFLKEYPVSVFLRIEACCQPQDALQIVLGQETHCRRTDLVMDILTGWVWYLGQIIYLPPRQLSILYAFLRHNGHASSEVLRQEIVDREGVEKPSRAAVGAAIDALVEVMKKTGPFSTDFEGEQYHIKGVTFVLFDVPR